MEKYCLAIEDGIYMYIVYVQKQQQQGQITNFGKYAQCQFTT